MKKQIRPAILSFIILTVLTGIIYPLVITGIAQLLFNKEANGSLIYKEGKLIGSRLIGQGFEDPKYFLGRPSATSPAYNAASSSGSNIGPSNPELITKIKARIEALQAVDPQNKNPVPVDLVTASASGLDPHLSMAGISYQIPRVAAIRGISEEALKKMAEKHTTGRLLGVIGEPVVNVLELNLALDDYNGTTQTR